MQKMIIADDDPMLGEIYKMTFSKDFEVFLAENGKIAVEIAKKEKIDIVLTDSVMPEMDGFELIKTLRNGEYDKNMKIFMLSNLSRPEDKDMASQLGANGYIVKANFNPSELLAEVKKLVQ